MITDSKRPILTYRNKLAPQFLIATLIYLIVVTGRALEVSGRNPETSLITYVLWSFFLHWKHLAIIITTVLIFTKFSPVILKEEEFESTSLWGINTKMKYSNINKIVKKYFLGISYFSLVPKEKVLLTPIVWGFLKNIDECIKEIEIRRSN